MKEKNPWPQNLYYDIFEEETKTPETLESDMDSVLNTLNAQEQGFLRMRYQEGLSINAAGRKAGLSPGRAHQIIQKALGRLRHDSRALILLHGRENLPAVLEEQKAEKKKGYLLKVAKEYGEDSPEYRAAQNSQMNRVDDGVLSVRTVNSLIRAGYRYLDELIPFDEDKLLKIRNLGVNSLKELKSRMVELGLLDPEADALRKEPETEPVWPENLIKKILKRMYAYSPVIEEQNLEAAIKTLPDIQQKIIVALYKKNMPIEKAAKKCRIAENTARSYESKALTHLRSNPRKAILFYGQDKLEELFNKNYRKKYRFSHGKEPVKLYRISESNLSSRAKSKISSEGFLFLNELVSIEDRALWKKHHMGKDTRNRMRYLEAIILK